ncbi:M14 family zinc carboxypeptidase [Sphingobacterium paludis]|uniref:Zinc carboxypeptidase n=1 Tax=Sphingobacterium paludis TaxID=1476465 RepID=A0A4R7CTI4_9SPHI|nr:M14 family zinc carboxypeptidase [Sphingobacterium paludis]TDS10324.1 zinc carboxypeptidase [Sphingobacterium paludis]
MKIHILAILVFYPFLGWSQLDYPSYSQLSAQINGLVRQSGAGTAAIGKSYGGENIPIIKIQQSPKPRPTLLVVAGIDGKHPAGILSAVALAKNIMELPKDSLSMLLKDHSIWIVPMLNPDAYKRNVAAAVWLSGNARIIDNDRDGRLNEDPLEDLNKDGVISQMRVRSLGGKYIAHKEYAHYLVEADQQKGERGAYELYAEGMDKDKDGLFGEDGDGGVNINRNFTFNYPAFTAESGDYAASEPETRAIVDLIFDNPQIATVVHFGFGNNLSEPERFDQGRASDRIIGSWLANDATVSTYVSDLYAKATSGLGVAPKESIAGGHFSSAAYYHMGKYSFSTPVWWPSVVDSSAQADKGKNRQGADAFLQWANANNVAGAILPWTRVNHPDFPNQEVEVGGVVDVFRNNPPQKFLTTNNQAHVAFTLALLHSMPKLEFPQPVVTALGDDIFRVDLRIVNTGLMPTYPEIADKIKHVSKMKTVCELQKNQKFLSGKRLQLSTTLNAGKTQHFSWLIQGKGTIEITAGCPTGGESTIKVTL